jgi:hypothetical protein
MGSGTHLVRAAFWKGLHLERTPWKQHASGKGCMGSGMHLMRGACGTCWHFVQPECGTSCIQCGALCGTRCIRCWLHVELAAFGAGLTG